VKTYTIVCGINGAGKSSLLGVLKSLSNMGRIVDAERYTKDSVVKFNDCRKAVKIIDESLEAGISFTQETTLAGYRIVKTIRKAVSLGYAIDLYYVGISTCEECNRRIVNRVVRGGIPIEKDLLEQRFKKRFDAFSKILKYTTKALFYDNQNGFVQVAEYKNDEIITIGSYKPQWVDELIEKYESDRDKEYNHK